VDRSYLAEAPRSRPLGGSGLTVSSLAWGMWRFAGDDLRAARAKIDAALDIGITLFDTADIYGPDNGEKFGAAETLLGRVFAEDRGLRDRMVLATKGGISMGVPYDSSPGYVAAAIDASLSRLGVDTIDLWQIHRPDILTHPQEAARALSDAVASGKVRSIGVSNYTVPQTRALMKFLDGVPLSSTQPELSALALAPIEDGTLDLAMQRNLAVLAWSPLGQGRIGAPADERSRAVAAALDAQAGKFGVSRTAAAYSWIMAHPAHPIPIVGTQNPARIREAGDATKVHWTRQDWYAVLVAARGERLP
jgi:aryl-alcohol dehydrogenase-like predicted oxidoreductase